MMNMLKKPLSAANLMTNKLKAASSKLEISNSSTSDTFNHFTDTLKSFKIESGANSSALSSAETEAKKDQQKTLEEEIWFHGVLPRLEVVRLLQQDGDFLVRETVRNEEKQIVLSVMWSSPKHFIVQTSPEGLFRFEGKVLTL